MSIYLISCKALSAEDDKTGGYIAVLEGGFVLTFTACDPLIFTISEWLEKLQFTDHYNTKLKAVFA
jgi:hypothetical protein